VDHLVGHGRVQWGLHDLRQDSNRGDRNGLRPRLRRQQRVLHSQDQPAPVGAFRGWKSPDQRA
jgi:hypothetical protein